jgi:hypothetical protein
LVNIGGSVMLLTADALKGPVLAGVLVQKTTVDATTAESEIKRRRGATEIRERKKTRSRCLYAA